MEMTENWQKRQYKTFNNLSCSLTSLPNPELLLIFNCKLLQHRAVADAHRKVDEHSRDQNHASQLRDSATGSELSQAFCDD